MRAIGRKNQSGVALILAIMIVALIAVVATEMSWRFELSVSRAGNRWAGSQARAYLEGAEQGFMAYLRADLEDDDNKTADYLGEPWSDQQEFVTDHGWVRGSLEDAQGRFNLNLMKPQDNPECPDELPRKNGNCRFDDCGRFTESHLVFIRLLQVFNLGDEEDDEPIYLQQEQAEEITESVIDWLDSNSTIRGNGAESDYYESLEPSVTIANKEMMSVSELQVIKGMPPQLYRQLLPHVIALPKGEATIINVNTASTELLRAMKVKSVSCELYPYDEEVGKELKAFVEEGQFHEPKDLKGADRPSQWADTNGYTDIFGSGKLMDVIESKYFILYASTAIGEEHIRRSKSLIYRVPANGTNGMILKVIRRTDANF